MKKIDFFKFNQESPIICIVSKYLVERQLALKKSDYRPSELAIKRFTNAKKFTNLMSRLDYQKVNINLFKKINRLLDNFDG